VGLALEGAPVAPVAPEEPVPAPPVPPGALELYLVLSLLLSMCVRMSFVYFSLFAISMFELSMAVDKG